MKKITILTLFILALLSLKVTAQALDEELISNLETFNGQSILVDNNKIIHFVFIDLWRSYEGSGDEKMIASLPEKFLQQSQQIWLQPQVNVTKAQLSEFQQYFPQVTPLILDVKFNLMRALKVWQSPFHVLLKDNEILFSGDAQALLNFIAKKHSVAVSDAFTANSVSSENEEESIDHTKNSPMVSDLLTKSEGKPVKPYKPVVGDKAPLFSAVTLSRKKVTLADALVRLDNSKPLNLVFIDALCPMPHFPDCESKLAQVNELIKADNSRHWLGVVNSYYVNEEFAQQFAEKFSLKLPLIFDQDNEIYRVYDVYASPYLIKINRQGLIESRSDVLN